MLGSWEVMPVLAVLSYGLEACPLRKSDLNSLDIVVNRLFMKLFQFSKPVISILLNVVSRTFALIYLV